MVTVFAAAAQARGEAEAAAEAARARATAAPWSGAGAALSACDGRCARWAAGDAAWRLVVATTRLAVDPCGRQGALFLREERDWALLEARTQLLPQTADWSNWELDVHVWVGGVCVGGAFALSSEPCGRTGRLLRLHQADGGRARLYGRPARVGAGGLLRFRVGGGGAVLALPARRR